MVKNRTFELCYASSLSHVWLFATPLTVACQTPLSVEFSSQEYCSGLQFFTPGIFPTPWSNPGLLHCCWVILPKCTSLNLTSFICKIRVQFGGKCTTRFFVCLFRPLDPAIGFETKYRLGIGIFLACPRKNDSWLDLWGPRFEVLSIWVSDFRDNNGHPEGRSTPKAAADDLYLWR